MFFLLIFFLSKNNNFLSLYLVDANTACELWDHMKTLHCWDAARCEAAPLIIILLVLTSSHVTKSFRRCKTPLLGRSMFGESFDGCSQKFWPHLQLINPRRYCLTRILFLLLWWLKEKNFPHSNKYVCKYLNILKYSNPIPIK